MLSSVLLCLIVLTTVSSAPVKYDVAKMAGIGRKQFFWFGHVSATFPEAQRLCALYGGQIVEPRDNVIHILHTEFAHTFWVNGYYGPSDTSGTSTWRWSSDKSPIERIYWDKHEPECKGDDCSHWRLFIANDIHYSKWATTDLRRGTKITVLCERPRP
ncbi:hypothetical protein HDE_13616 [Halotydeus destructor]|nr:hypothetical protein HDE_13616 [Halotydeus destructor]